MKNSSIGFSEVSEHLKVVDFEFTASRLWIAYDFNGKEMNLECDPEQAAKLLQSTGYLDEYQIIDGEIEVRVDVDMDVDGKFRFKSRPVSLPWKEFVLAYPMNQILAHSVAVSHEQDKIVRGLYIHDLPKMVEKLPELIPSL